MTAPKHAKNASSRLIVALDVADSRAAMHLVDRLHDQVALFKIGLQLYTAAGPEIVRAVTSAGAGVFLDLKLHDIPNTVARAVESAAALDVAMLTVHLSGGSEMLRQAQNAAEGTDLMLLGVTVLTSSSQATLQETGIAADLGDHVIRLARLGVAAGIGGFVASPHEVQRLRGEIGAAMKIVTPGIRPAGAAAGDQKRIMTPRQAVQSGADYLVVGRPVIAAPDPAKATHALLAELRD